MILVIIFFTLAAIFLACELIFDWDGFGFVASFIFIFLMLIGLLMIPINRANTRQNIREINTLKQTIESQRKQHNDLENAAITNKIIESNQLINETKRDNSLWYYNWCIDDSIDTVQLVK